eukprot:5846695-Pyramimonas_sp.AAC.1
MPSTHLTPRPTHARSKLKLSQPQQNPPPQHQRAQVESKISHAIAACQTKAKLTPKTPPIGASKRRRSTTT